MSRSTDIKADTVNWARDAVSSEQEALRICDKIEHLTAASLESTRHSTEAYTPTGDILFLNNGWRRLWEMPPNVMSAYNMLTDLNLHGKVTWPAIKEGFNGTAGATPEALFSPEEIGMPGRRRWTDGYIAPVLDSEEQAARVILMLRDITDVKLAFTEICELRNRLQELQFQYEGIIQRLDDLSENSTSGTKRLVDLPSANFLEAAVKTLSNRERQIFAMLARDQTVKEIAYDLAIDTKSVYTYRMRLMSKMKLQSSLQIAAAYSELRELLSEPE